MTAAASGQTGSTDPLAPWAAPYVTSMLGKGAATANTGYQGYQGPLSAGPSSGQQSAFQGVAGLAVPTQQMGAYQPEQFSAQAAQDYMNPYLQAALNPQIEEANRQAQMQRLQNASRLTQAGAYGGSRQAIMESEGDRNLQQNLAGITGKGYETAYDKAMNQFNTEQGRLQSAQKDVNSYGLQALAAQNAIGADERSIEQAGVMADLAQFEEERDFPYKQVQYQQSLLQGLPISAQQYAYQEPSALSEGIDILGGITDLFKGWGT